MPRLPSIVFAIVAVAAAAIGSAAFIGLSGMRWNEAADTLTGFFAPAGFVAILATLIIQMQASHRQFETLKKQNQKLEDQEAERKFEALLVAIERHLYIRIPNVAELDFAPMPMHSQLRVPDDVDGNIRRAVDEFDETLDKLELKRMKGTLGPFMYSGPSHKALLSLLDQALSSAEQLGGVVAQRASDVRLDNLRGNLLRQFT